MGQTLTHGVYLPAEGERNCYDGLASNWNILDGAVGTIAEHTTALAGKAPAVHTHTKSDVTDLLNSNFIPSVNNSYDLGSSSYQWNNIYSKGYYYNGVAWGLDKYNTWSQINDFKTLRLYGVVSNNLIMYPPSGEKGDSSTFGFNILCSDKNLGNYSTSGVANVGMGQSNGTSYVALNASTKGSTDNNIHSIQIGLQIAASDNANIGSFYPTQNGGINLGTSTNKWKSLNGINPGALSLPDMDSTVSKSTELATAIDKTRTANSWTADFTGILCITWFVKNLTGPFRCTVSNNSDIRYATWGQTFSVNDSWFFIVSFPVQNGKTYYFDNSFTRTSEDTAPIIYGASAVYCLGNV